MTLMSLRFAKPVRLHNRCKSLRDCSALPQLLLAQPSFTCGRHSRFHVHARSTSSSSRLTSSSTACSLSCSTSSSSSSISSSSSVTSMPKQSNHTRSYTQMIVNQVSNSLTNGILAHDDILRHGVPSPKFDFRQTHLLNEDPASTSLSSIFEASRHIDPFSAVDSDLTSISHNISNIIGSDHSVLNQIASYFFNVNGKRIRPAVVLLLSRALNRGLIGEEHESLAAPTALSPTPSSPFVDVSQLHSRHRDGLDSIAPSQQRISEIAELIHTASLLHDDVIDESATRRGVPSINAAYGNKFAILGGDFLLARASVSLARLRNPIVIELMSTIIEHLVKGEILQLKGQQAQTIGFVESASASSSPATTHDSQLSLYMTKTFYKTASLLANSCKSAAILGGHSAKLQEIAFEYGKHLGMAFQIVDDILDLEGDAGIMGKPKSWDLTHGIVTAPVLFAMQTRPELRSMIEHATRNKDSSSYADEMSAVHSLILSSGGIARARVLAQKCAEDACAAVLQLRASVPRSALVQLLRHVLDRKK